MKRNKALSALFTFLLAIVLVISGCKSGAKATPYTKIFATLAPDSSISRVKEFQDKGNLSLLGATFLAKTRLEVTSNEKNLYKFVATFPTNSKTDITVKLTPNQKYTPTQEELSANPGSQIFNAGLTYSITGSTYNLKLAYFLPNGVLPISFDTVLKATLSQLVVTEGAGTFQYQPAVYRKGGPGFDVLQVAEGGGEQTGTTVALQIALFQAGQEFVSAAEEFITGVEGSPLINTATSALEVVEVLNTSLDYQDMVTELDGLQTSAENPINPLTQAAYADDPGLRQRILDEISNTRTELMLDNLALYLNSEVSVGSGLMGLPILSVAMAPLTSWNSNTLRQVMRERMRNVRNMVTTGTGSLNPRPGSGGSGNNVTPLPGVVVPTNTVTLKPGTWVASYEGVHKEVGPISGSYFTYTDIGTISFTINDKGFTVEGTGNGHLPYHSVVPPTRESGGSHIDGVIDYTFTLGGYVMGGSATLMMSSLPTPAMFQVLYVPDKGSSSTSDIICPMPLISSPVKLEMGAVSKIDQDTTMYGVHVTETRTLTITRHQP